ncbi:MAG: ribonuclease H-like domain-containing protein [Kiritimatiellae bacterium]|nr:ribonuclease H-like domain-containing protein [Kiritimatiellia bacterium]
MGKLDDLHARLEALNRRPLKEELSGREREIERLRRKLREARGKAGSKPTRPIVYRRDLPRRERLPHPRPALPDGPPVVLEDSVAGCMAESPTGERAYLIEVPACELEGDWEPLCDAFHSAFETAGSDLRQRLARACPGEWRPADTIFLDIETTGLSTSPLFLIGTMSWQSGLFVIRQYFARHYAEERGVIALFLRDFTAGNRLLVTFNGKSYDWPYIRTRAAATGVPFASEPAHFDLLHEARRVWKHVLPDCRLKTLEAQVCGRRRGDDIPSDQIPDAYHAYVRSDNAVQIASILRHNMFDLLTLADLMLHLPAPADA